MLAYCQLDPWEQTSVKFESKYKIFIHENAFENVACEMATRALIQYKDGILPV